MIIFIVADLIFLAGFVVGFFAHAHIVRRQLQRIMFDEAARDYVNDKLQQ